MINWAANLPAVKPKYRAIIQLIKSLIQNDQLLPGQRLPAERQLATWLHVDRSTVSRALADLSAQGVLVKRRGSGTFVAQIPQLKPLTTSVNWQLLRHPITPGASLQAQLAQARGLDHGQFIDGAAAGLPPELIPQLGRFQLDWTTYLAQQSATTTMGDPALLTTLSRQPALFPQLDLTHQTLMVAGGAEQSLFLVLSSLLQPGDAVAVVTPSYFNATAVFQTLSIHTYPVPLTATHFALDRLEQTIRQHRIKLLITNPTFENPTGETLSLTQRQQLLRLCQHYQIPIVEDDVFGWLVTDETAMPPLKVLSPANVIYISSLSKLLGANTRIGWLIAPQAIGQRLLQVQKQLDMVPSLLAQTWVNLALNSPHFDSELTRLTTKLTQRRQAVAAIFHRYRPAWRFTLPQGGFYLWVHQADRHIFNQLLAQDILVQPGTVFGADRSDFRFNVAGMTPLRQRELARRLAANQSD
ncbi:aminotransferase-like domain-containing protein [Levilactobacillus acidifarinae]|uniref:Aminotransferase n=1 Tax=Levilactobacillus acidifarinae DSM 19394 = JCM 15949 TaxID=1423715 RepID=A0A0R1LWE9_9LACO|nr:PLP-dependent aminotransferase family protein [Levilactobacillus acidifarinae]KRK96023.1 aminotransferase [Levilactobacillus acidifarinae DSM 19394]GEO69705.1 GntR family transcriptional regulator [Levilactobacillus acidifarinae]